MIIPATIAEILEWLAGAEVPEIVTTGLREYLIDASAREIDRNAPRDDDDDGPHPIAVLDQRALMSGRKIKWYQHRAKKTAICMHHTAVHRGFGVPRTLTARISKHHVTLPKILEWPTPPPAEADATRLFGLAARYRGDWGEGTPYHAIVTTGAALVLNLPFDFVSWHGNGANKESLGIAWDGNSNHEQPADTAGTIAAICYVVATARAEGHPIRTIVCHSQFSNKPSDPGQEFVETILVPVAALIGLDLDRGRSAGNGRPLREVLS